MTSIDVILRRLGLEAYTERFTAEGFDTWETVLHITESDLSALGVRLGHHRILQQEIAQARGVSADYESPNQHDLLVMSAGDISTDDGIGFGNASQKTKRKYNRHPKPDEQAPKRPPSAYVLFSNKVRDESKTMNLSFTEIAKRVGQRWQSLSEAEKEPYEAQATAAKEVYHNELAAYKRTEAYSQYMQYLVDFKERHQTSLEGPKRTRLPGEQGETNSTRHGSREREHSAQRASDGHSNMKRPSHILDDDPSHAHTTSLRHLTARSRVAPLDLHPSRLFPPSNLNKSPCILKSASTTDGDSIGSQRSFDCPPRPVLTTPFDPALKLPEIMSREVLPSTETAAMDDFSDCSPRTSHALPMAEDKPAASISVPAKLPPLGKGPTTLRLPPLSSIAGPPQSFHHGYRLSQTGTPSSDDAAFQTPRGLQQRNHQSA